MPLRPSSRPLLRLSHHNASIPSHPPARADHWGIHGWVPYILLALTLGVVSFRWGLPPTIRSCFYPLLGDHALGPLGDIIDSLSVATTTFGVCTSLGLGVSTLAVGLEYVRNINCDRQANCVAAGGVWCAAPRPLKTSALHPPKTL
mgnify:CR=1 FL=1